MCRMLLPLTRRPPSYPLSCIRLQPVKRCHQAGQQGALDSFLSDVRERLQSVCGFTARLTTKPRQHRDVTSEVHSHTYTQTSSSSFMVLPQVRKPRRQLSCTFSLLTAGHTSCH